MDVSSFTCNTPEVKRLTSFQRRPLQSQQKLGISNSPAKLAKAGFMRQEDATADEVTCDECGIVYSEWSGESPYAVHRVLNENCPFLNTPSSASLIQNHPRVVRARRQLFQDESTAQTDAEESDESSASNDDFSNNDENGSSNAETDDEIENVGDQAESDGSMNADSDSSSTDALVQSNFISVLHPRTNFDFPFQPKVGGASSSMLFASRRLKTFTDPGCPECVEWAEAGFMYRADTRDVQCIFCAVVLPFHTCEPSRLHEQRSQFCPCVLFKDVGNISCAEEERIKLKNLQRQLKNKSTNRSYAVRHPQYEDEGVRLGTYENWPQLAANVKPADLSEAGFYFTGCADKVVCNSCGVGLLKWRQGSDPWLQHALHMPTCPHLHAKGEHFIQQAAQAQVLTVADMPTSSSSSPSGGSRSTDSPSSTGQLVTSPPGSLTLDMCAVTAALATSQYSAQQVRHAVLTFFCHTSRYPTKDILFGQLRAADDNFTTVCQQRETIHQKDTALQQKATALQQKDTALQQKDMVIQQTHIDLQRKDTELQQHVGIVEQQNQVIHQRDEELEQQRAELQAREEELERKTRQMAYKEAQIESLQIQMAALLSDRRQAGLQAAPLRAAVLPAPHNPDGSNTTMSDIRCKVCLSEESNTIFTPCQHITCCSRCAQQLVNACCPVCRAPIRKVLPAYIA